MSSLTTISHCKRREKTTAFIAPMTVSDSVSGTTSYTTNSLNQYTNIAALVPVYDGNGNLTSINGWTYAYDAQNRLLSAQSAQSASSAEVFSYDPQNRCVSRSLTVSGTTTTTNFFYDGWQLAEELDASGTEQALYVSGARTDELLYKATPAATVFYQHDALGSTTALTDASGNLIERYTYDVYGKPSFFDANNNPLTASAYNNRFLYTGREWLQEVGLYDYRNRVYSADLGRFLQTDPMQFSAGDVNVYRYCGNGVVDSSDPNGLLFDFYDVRAFPSGTLSNGKAIKTNGENELCDKDVDQILKVARQQNQQQLFSYSSMLAWGVFMAKNDFDDLHFDYSNTKFDYEGTKYPSVKGMSLGHEINYVAVGYGLGYAYDYMKKNGRPGKGFLITPKPFETKHFYVRHMIFVWKLKYLQLGATSKTYAWAYLGADHDN